MRFIGILVVVLMTISTTMQMMVDADELRLDEGTDFELWDAYAPTKSEKNPPKISCPAAVALDTTNGRILFQKNAFAKRQMASTTKMMTAILAIEKANLNDVVTVSKRAAYIRGSQAHLKVGEKMKMEHLLYALMLPSGNDAAIAIAEHIAGSVENFIVMMDQKAKEIGASNTKYGSPHGLDRNNYSTAYDLAIIARYCLQNPMFAKVVSTRYKVIPRQGIPEGKQYKNTNKLLFSYEGMDGVKTGYTGPAGRCLVSSATRDGWQVISVVLGANSSYNRFYDSRKILDYVFNNFPLITILPDGQRVVDIPVVKGQKDNVYAVNRGEIRMHLNDSELVQIERDFIIPEQLVAPVHQNQKVGKVVVRLGEQVVGSCDLCTEEGVAFWTVEMNWKKIFREWIKFNHSFKGILSRSN